MVGLARGTLSQLAVRIAAVVALAAVAICPRTARADNVTSLIDQLGNDDSEKVRLSAALNLTKVGDGSTKVILALAKALLNDSDKDVRGACAVGLGKLVTARTSGAARGLAIKDLQQAAASDASDFVKSQAQKALVALGAGSSGTSQGGGPSVNGGAGGVYVNIGPMSSKTGGDDAKLRALMVRVATQTLAKDASTMLTSWAGGAPSKAALTAKRVAGFYVDGTLNELKVSVSGNSSTISCKVSMLLADFPDKSVFGFLNGGASVTAGASASDQALAGQDCVEAVIENLISNKIIPTIRSKVP